MHALVTGATGFIGGRLAELLLARGVRVRLLVRNPEAAAKIEHLRGAEFVRGDVTNGSTLAPALEGIEVVFHVAGLSADWGKREEFEAINVQGARSLAEAAAARGVKRFVHVSTTDVFGYPEIACASDGPTRDLGLPYNSSKLRGELAVREVARATSLPLVVIRPATVYGPRSKDFALELANLIARKDMMVVNGGRAPAGLLYVDNLCDAMIEAATRPIAIGKIYVIRDPGKQTWREYVDRLADGLSLPRVTMSLPAWLAFTLGAIFEFFWSITRARSRPLLTRHVVYVMSRDQSYGAEPAIADLEFTSRISFDEGMRRTIEWLRATRNQPS
ncbi:MAG: NAD-dependent epimerase/dehydratase family protein [Archangium sp.]|nr:NAD-dependent epimerase/dehydratase family protein [Archangium sp.]